MRIKRLALLILMIAAAPPFTARAETAACREANTLAQTFFNGLDRELKTCMSDCSLIQIPAQRAECQATCKNQHRQRTEIRKESVQIACAKPEIPSISDLVEAKPSRPRAPSHVCFGPDGKKRKCDGKPHAGLHDDFNTETELETNGSGSQ